VVPYDPVEVGRAAARPLRERLEEELSGGSTPLAARSPHRIIIPTSPVGHPIGRKAGAQPMEV